MNSLPPGDRGAGGGMNQTFQNSAQVLSIGIFFTLMIARPREHAAARDDAGLEGHGVSAASRAAGRRAAADLDPLRGVPRLQPDPAPRWARTCSPRSPPANRATLTGRSFFPHLISAPFRNGLHEAFLFAIVACLIAAAASLMRGGPLSLQRARRQRALASAPVADVSAGRERDGGVAVRRRTIPDPRGAACRLSGTDSRRFA